MEQSPAFTRYSEVQAERARRKESRQELPAVAARYRNDEAEAPGHEPVRCPRSFAYILAAQTLVCFGLLSLAFLWRWVAPHSFAAVSQSYRQAMRADWPLQEVWRRTVAVCKGLRQDVYVLAAWNGNPTTTSPAPSAPAGAAGGEDIALQYATKNCVVAPLRTTARPTHPLPQSRLTSPFGYRIHPITGEPGVHTGLDLAAPEGDPIAAAYYGVVAEVGEGPQLGNYVVIDHAGGLQSVYAHCSAVLAKEGMVLRAGDIVALVGSTGQSTGPHLHFELRLHGMRCDPQPLLLG